MRPLKPTTNLAEFSAFSERQKLEHLVKFASFAPSSHNTQPWLFDFDGNQILVHFDPNRLLTVSDPTGRQMHLSIGSAIENIVFSAEYFGLQALVEYVFQDTLIAKISFIPSSEKNTSVRIENIFSRHSNRFEYQDRLPDSNFLDWLNHQSDQFLTVHVIKDLTVREKIIEAVANALKEAMDDKPFRRELSNWIKSSRQSHEDGMPGYNLGMPAPVSFIFPHLLRIFKMGNIQKAMDSKVLRKTPVFVIISTKLENQRNWTDAGKKFEAIALEAENYNLNTSVLAAAIEMKEYHKDLQKILQTAERPLIFFRLGYAEKYPTSSPRLSYAKTLKLNK